MEIQITQRGEITDHQGGVKDLDVHPNGKIFFARSDEMLVIYDIREGRKLKGFYDSAGYESAMFDPATGMLVYQSDEKLHFWDLATWRERMVHAGELFEFRNSDMHPESGLYAVAGEGGRIELRTITADSFDSPDFVLEGHGNYVEYVRFHPSGKILSSGSADMTLRFWDIPGRQEISSHKVHSDFVTAIAFNPSGNVMISGDYKGNIKIWDFKIIS